MKERTQASVFSPSPFQPYSEHLPSADCKHLSVERWLSQVHGLLWKGHTASEKCYILRQVVAVLPLPNHSCHQYWSSHQLDWKLCSHLCFDAEKYTHTNRQKSAQVQSSQLFSVVPDPDKSPQKPCSTCSSLYTVQRPCRLPFQSQTGCQVL